jgi:hypothetical protein
MIAASPIPMARPQTPITHLREDVIARSPE